MIDFSRSIKHPFEDPAWAKKLGIGALVNLVPILNFASAGYLVAHLRNVSRNQDAPLPDWNNLSDYFADGLKQFVVGLVYASPLLLLTCVVYGAFFAIALTGGSESGRNMDAAMNRAMEQFGPAFICLFCLIGLLSLVYGFLSPAITIQFARTGSIGACLRFGEVFDIIRQRSKDYILAFVVPIAIAFALSMVLAISAIIPPLVIVLNCLLVPLFIIASAYISVSLAHIYGQLARGLIDGTPASTTPSSAPPMLPPA